MNFLEKELEKVQAKKDEAVEDAADVVDKEIELDNLLAAKKIANQCK